VEPTVSTPDAVPSRGGHSAGGPGDGELVQASPATKGRKNRPWWQELVILLVCALVAVWFVTTFVARSFSIPSGSMEDTLHLGYGVLVLRITPRLGTIQRGYVVVFDGTESFSPYIDASRSGNAVTRALAPLTQLLGIGPARETDFIKRVIAVGGDHVVCCDDQGRVSVNGHPLDEPYVRPGDIPSMIDFDVVVPEGRLWVMGDHRSASADSRSHLGDPGGGTVAEDRVIGRAFVVSWPVAHWATLGRAPTFDDVPAPSPSSVSR
jgi:signal peptidase I